MKIASTRGDVDRSNIEHKIFGTLARVAQARDEEDPKVFLGGKPPLIAILPDVCNLKFRINHAAELHIVWVMLRNKRPTKQSVQGRPSKAIYKHQTTMF